MSKEYRILTAEMNPILTDNVMRVHCQRPGKRDYEGKIIYFTEQAHKNICDMNQIIKKYDKTGLISHVSKIEAKYGDLTGMDFKNMQDKVAGAKSMFNDLPSEIRKRFQNSPQKLIEFMDDASNRDEAIKLGLINPMWTEETDGLGIGEHIKSDDERKIKETVVEELVN